jgi:L-rhamnose-H+ transport protein
MDLLTLGVVAIIGGGVLNGGFTFPMKFVKNWRWENMWLGFGFFGLLVLPTLVALITIPQLGSVYASAAPSALGAAAALGICWGIGSLLFGLSVSALGMSLGYSIIMATTTICGTLVPAILLNASMFETHRAAVLLASLALILGALILCAIAGRRREMMKGAGAAYQTLTRTRFRKGLLLAVLAGLLSACFNIGFAVTRSISASAERFGAPRTMSTFSVWALIMNAGFLPSLAYCLYLIRRNGSLPKFRADRQNVLYVLIMGVLWILGVALYGAGATFLGDRGATVGWPILMSVTILTANGIGLLSGEWKGVGPDILRRLYAGLTLLLAAVVLAGMAGIQ